MNSINWKFKLHRTRMISSENAYFNRWLLLSGVFMCALFLGAEVKAQPKVKTFNVGLIFRMDDKLNGVELSKGIDTAKSLFEKTYPDVQIKFHRFPHDDEIESIVKASQEVLKKKLPAVIGGELSEEAFVLRDAFEGKKTVLLTPTSTNPLVTQGQPYVFRFCLTDQQIVSDLAKMTLKSLKPKVIGVVNNVSSPYSAYVSKQFLETLNTEQANSKTKIPVFEERILEDTIDLEAQIQNFIDKKVTHVVIPVHPSKFVHFVTQARAKRFYPVYIGSDGWGSSENIWQRLVENSSDRATFVAYRAWFWNDRLITPLGNDFRKEYFVKYKDNPSGFAAIGFDTAWVLFSAMNQVSKPQSGEEIQKALVQLKGLNLATTKSFYFEKDHSPSGGVHIYKIDESGVHFQETFK